jgi:hypothetical protein
VGFSCCALHWLSAAPVLLTGTPYWFSPRVNDTERHAGRQKAGENEVTYTLHGFRPNPLLDIVVEGLKVWLCC